ncbi:hypothetical protein L204_105500 [Cryptococcus depauperatus]|nr:serine/threonine protein kinase [Cryptococcus depauperatus CBS 7855]
MSPIRDTFSRRQPTLTPPPLSSRPGAESSLSMSAGSSRNDLFTASWQPDLPPPRPLSGNLGRGYLLENDIATHAPSGKHTNGVKSHASTLPMRRRDLEASLHLVDDGVDEFGIQKHHLVSSVSASTSTLAASALPRSRGFNLQAGGPEGSSKTSSFFDVSTGLPAPPPAPKLASAFYPQASINSLSSNDSQSSSLRHFPAPLHLAQSGPIAKSTGGEQRHKSWNSYTSSTSSSPPSVTVEEDHYSPLHQSPKLPPAKGDWMPPLPSFANDISLRCLPRDKRCFLGEGRYARVQLAAYKQLNKTNGEGGMLGRVLPGMGMKEDLDGKRKINQEGDGLEDGSWRLCAVKRLAGDRESQTMGLREAFFLNRLMVNESANHERNQIKPKQRAASPLREAPNQPTPPYTPESHSKRKHKRSVYITRLIAVKEDPDPQLPISHLRSSSDTYGRKRESLTRQRSSSMLPAHSPPTSIKNDVVNKLSRDNSKPDAANMPSFPSHPSLVQAMRQEMATPSLSQLVLVFEFAHLGTMDRFLRDSPQLIGKKIWSRWARESCEALEWVHRKRIVHADVKPGNLLLTRDMHIRLSDFGSSLLIHSAHTPTDGLGLGTLPFAAPELVDNNQTFSFPIDIFALGATLYQCITGREPFRGLRSYEMIHYVRKGGLWAYEEQERLARIGEPLEAVLSGTPYPSAWRDPYQHATTSGGIRRTGSLRVPSAQSPHQPLHASEVHPKLNRVQSREFIQAEEDASKGGSPGGVKSYMNWAKGLGSGGGEVVEALLVEGEFPSKDIFSNLSRSNSLRRSNEFERKPDIADLEGEQQQKQSEVYPSEPSAAVPSPLPHPSPALSASPTSPSPSSSTPNLFQPYTDGSPAMMFLSGTERVPEEWREVLQGMLEPDQEMRLTTHEVLNRWDEVGVSEEI